MPFDLSKLAEASLDELQAAHNAQKIVVADAKTIHAAIKEELCQRYAEAAVLKKMTPAQLDKLINRKVGQGAVETKGASAAGA